MIYVLLSLALAGIAWINQRYTPNEQPPITAPSENKEVSNTELYKVVSIQDGDTITVSVADTDEKVRLIGVDTPETRDPRTSVQCYGKAASEYTKSLLLNQQVELVKDPTNNDRDRYNRLLRYVYLSDGKLVNASIIEQGYGFAYTIFPFEKMNEFKLLEQSAKERNLGLWGSCNVEQEGDKKITNPS